MGLMLDLRVSPPTEYASLQMNLMQRHQNPGLSS